MAITRAIGRVLDWIAPSVGARARAVWYTLNGARFENMSIQQRNQDEWFFQDLKNFVQTVRGIDNTYAVQDSVDRLAQLGDSGASALAVVSVIPPSKTGIADYTLKAFSAADFPVDVFFPHGGTAEYLAAKYRVAGSGHLQTFSLEALDAGVATRGYMAVVWVLGNSEHNVEVAKLLRSTRHLPRAVPSWIEVHDPVLLHLISRVARQEGVDFAHIVQQSSAVDLAGVNWERVNRGDHMQLVERGVTGLRALLNDVPLQGIIFHSHAARELMWRDWPDFDRSRARVLFLPVSDSFEASKPAPAKGSLRIGSFGVPGNHKQTERIIESFRLIRMCHPEATLLLAGFGTARYVQDHEDLVCEPGLIVEDSPSTQRLMDLMREVDIAVQLRAKNTGESSGVIPQLLALNTIVVATAIGAQTDYGEAVRYVQSDCPPEELANVIVDEVAHYERRMQSRADYVLAHSPERFVKELVEIIRQGAAPVPHATASAKQQPSASRLAAVGATQMTTLTCELRILREQLTLLSEMTRSSLSQTPLHQAAEIAEFRARVMTEIDRRYRGSEAALHRELTFYKSYIERVKDLGPVLDIGCGRGTFLEIATSVGAIAEGIDTSKIQVDACCARGLKVTNIDAIAFLRNAPPKSYAMVSMIHLVEHLSFDDLLTIIREIERVLVPGGVILIETPNPENLYISTNMFHVDPTHLHPITFQLMETILSVVGFAVTRLPLHVSVHDDEGSLTGNLHLDHMLRVSANLSILGEKPLTS